MRAKPPIKVSEEKNERKNDFIDGAKNKKEIKDSLKHPDPGNSFPWDDPKVRTDMTKTFNIRLSEPDYLKLKYISDNTPDSMHTFCLNALIPEIEKHIKKLTF